MKWIKTADRMPNDKNTGYLVTLQDGETGACLVYPAGRRTGGWELYTSDDTWTVWDVPLYDGDDRVTAWAPMPAAYEEDSTCGG